MKEGDLKLRTKQFALDVIRYFETLPKDEVSRIPGRQLLRAGTSVEANYRAAKRAKSNADFIGKMGTVEEEADGCGYWLELLIGNIRAEPEKPLALLRESEELPAITVASINTARRRGNSERGSRDA